MDTDFTVGQLLSEPMLSAHHTQHALERYLTARLAPFERPDPATWEAEAEGLRRRVLDEVIFRGAPEGWRTEDLDVVWGEVIETGRGYRIRKLRYLALQGLWIPALLYEPDGLTAPAPAVLNLNGHVGPPGKAIDYKQLRCINLAKRGMLALNPEWMKFGELQGAGYDHNRSACLDLCGVAGVAVFYLAMRRALDLLLAHEHADPERVAVTGLSGGGWQTIILGALDTRVRLAAPNAGYIGMESRIRCREDIGDIEQNATDLTTLADYPVLTAMLAPRPALLIYNQEDDCCFQTERARPSVFEPVAPLYEALGRADAFRFHNNTDPGTHNYDLDNRQQFYRFLNRHFLPPEARVDEEIPSDDEILSEEALTVGLPEGNADFTALAASIAEGLPRRTWPHGDTAAVASWQREGRARLREVLRYRPLEVTESRNAGERTAGGRRVVRYTLHLGEEWSLPALDIRGTDASRELLVVTADEGCAAAEGMVRDALGRDMRVLVVDILLHGECRSPSVPSSQWTMMASATGARLLGVQTAQLAAAARWAAKHAGMERITIAGLGRVSSVVALAAASIFGPALERVITVDMASGFRRLIEGGIPYEDCPSLFCFGLFEAFDIRELIGLLAPAPVDVVSPEGTRTEADLLPLRELYARFGCMGFQPRRETWTL